MTDQLRYIVVKKDKKQFRFDCVKPFDVSKKIQYINNSFFIQVTLANLADRCIFIEDAKFRTISD